MEIRAGGSGCLIIFAFCLVPRAAPAAACGYFKCPFGSVEYGIIFQGLVPAFVMDLAARLLFANKEIKSEALIDLNFYNFLQWHGLSLVILRCNEFMLIHDLFFSPPLHWDSLHALNSKWCSGIVEKMDPELDNYSTYLCCVSQWNTSFSTHLRILYFLLALATQKGQCQNRDRMWKMSCPIGSEMEKDAAPQGILCH